jgi:predicted acyltransferase
LPDISTEQKKRSRWWNGCFLVLTVGWGLILIVGFATTFEGPAWTRFGPPGYDMGLALVFFAGLGILYVIKRGAEAIWDWLGRDGDDNPTPDA